MNAGELTSTVHIGAGKTCSRAELYSLLNTYNCFLKDKTHLQLKVHESAGGGVILEGILVISWGVKKPIQLKIQDEKQIYPGEHPLKSPDPISPLGNKRGMTRWGEFDDLHHIDELAEVIQDGSQPDHPAKDYIEYESKTLRPLRSRMVSDESSNLFRTMSDASLVKMRVKSKRMSERQNNRNYRFSINGHFYNYKTSIFTPSYGATTNVNIDSEMTTQEVITQLLHKFKIENNPKEFALYCIHQSGERKRLNGSDLPLWERVLQGPSDSIMRMFLMDSDEEEVSLDVAQYLNLELPILKVVLQKLEEQENQEIQRIISKYQHQRKLILQYLNKWSPVKTETAV